VRRLVYLLSAQDDLNDIFRYIAREAKSRAVGETFVRSLRQQCRHLSSLPGTLGASRPELRPDIRSFAFKGYVIFFRYQGDLFEVVNILEGHRDIIGHFQTTRS
jgi:toxin ParE1/3/4